MDDGETDGSLTRAGRRHFMRTVYLQQCRSLAHMGILGFRSAQDALLADKHDECWFAIHGLLSASARLSLLVKTRSRKGSEETPRRWRLRRARARWLSYLLEIPHDSPVHSRAIRNSQEHIDERLDDFLSTGPGLFQSYVIQPARVSRMIAYTDGGEPVDVRSDAFFWLDPEEMVLSFLSEEIRIVPLHQELMRIHHLADARFRANFL